MKRAPIRPPRPVQRRPGPPRVAVELENGEAVYAVELSAVPSRPWRAVFLRPPRPVATPRLAGEAGRVELREATVHFRARPQRLEACVRRIDRWIKYANSVVAE